MNDIRSYRTAAFLQSTVLPRLEQSRDLSLLELDRFVLDILDGEKETLGFSADDAQNCMRVMLLLEAVGWLQMGASNGHFAASWSEMASDRLRAVGGDEQDALLRSASDRNATYGQRLATRETEGSKLADFEFLESIVEVHEQTSRDHLTYLRLALLAPDDEWATRLNEVKAFANLLTSTPNLHLGDSAVDRVTWAMHGAEPTGIARTPSRWRYEWILAARNLLPHTALGRHVRARAADRLGSLEVTRDRILSALVDLTEDEVGAAVTVFGRSLGETLDRAQDVLRWGTGLSAEQRLQLEDEDPEQTRESGRTVRETTKLKYMQAGGSDYEGTLPNSI